MTLFEWTLIRFARQHMTPDEVLVMEGLAARADRGDDDAHDTFHMLIWRTIRDQRRYQNK